MKDKIIWGELGWIKYTNNGNFQHAKFVKGELCIVPSMKEYTSRSSEDKEKTSTNKAYQVGLDGPRGNDEEIWDFESDRDTLIMMAHLHHELR